jgi:hypothetical protein
MVDFSANELIQVLGYEEGSAVDQWLQDEIKRARLIHELQTSKTHRETALAKTAEELLWSDIL